MLLILTVSAGMILGVKAQFPATGLQNAVNKVTSTAKSVTDVSSTASGIVSKLTSSLSLTKAQIPQVTATVTNFLKEKAGILKLKTTNKAEYDAKLKDLSAKLDAGMKKILTQAQYTKFLKLKPAEDKASNVLSQLFY